MVESTRRRVPDDSRGLLCCIDDVLEKIFGYIKKPVERNAISAVCKRFHELEARTRHHVLVYNMYAVNPMKLFERFPSVRSITIKGNPRLVDFDILPRDWAGHAGPWIAAIKAHPQLNRFRIKRMTITDSQIEELCAACGPNLKIMQFDKCSGFSTKGLQALAKFCKNLTHLGLAQSMIDNTSDTKWLKDLVNSCPALEYLDLSLIEMGDVDEAVLVKLAERCKLLKLWESETQNSERFLPVLQKCSSNLSDLGIERINSNSETSLLAKCTALEGLSGIFDLVDDGMHAFMSVSSRLTRLDLSYSNLTEVEIAEVLRACPNLQYLRVLDLAGDHGLQALGNSCKDLHRLVVESPSAIDGGVVTHAGLMAVAQGCRNLQKLIFYPSFITNEAFYALAYNCPNLMDVRICLIQSSSTGENMPWECLDEGVTALVRECRSLYRLTLCFDVQADVEFLTDAGVAAIGEYGKKIRVLTLVHCGSSDMGLVPVLRGCNKLQRLEIRKCRFGDESMQEIALNSELHLKHLFVQGCEVTIDGLSSLAYRAKHTNSRFYVEVIGCKDGRCLEEHRYSCTDESCEDQHRFSLSCSHWQILAYHSLTEPRDDTPWFIHRFDSILSEASSLPFTRAEPGGALQLMPESSSGGIDLDLSTSGIDLNEDSSEPLQLMPESSGSGGGGGSGGIDLNEPAEESCSSFPGFERKEVFHFPDILERVAAEPTLHLGAPLVL
ncbi:protein AUXIN SIGNALING F-BOX 2 [Selaginella moellendorffii]|uniref:protein AUXIN SIGNALING F-BOX 2 n=1 Tax=Selaginella moellendorffii TaxID=88036 RepID=UPI000D1C8036|nr:protein AUXIN SIGNALING F-BOX 2 [Selaginella moellendorffii]|eukprot:XP_002976462.2 protein AUXIN SIGNALING F-BOX 2 [Selaginella moellendorffii]